MMQRIVDDKFLSRLEAASLYVRTHMQGYFGGNHATRFHGSTVEFSDYREYALGDDLRRIDWNLFGRFEKYFIKQFVDERQMHIQIFLDCSASMNSDPDKSFYARRLAAALGFLSVHNMDRVSYRLIKGAHAEDLCGTVSGKQSFFEGIAKLESLSFKGEADLEKAILGCPSAGTSNGLSVVISDFLTDSNFKRAVDYLLFQKRQVMLVQVLSVEETDPFYSGRTYLLDAEAEDASDEKNLKINITKDHLRAYREALADFKEDIRRFCSARQVGFYSVVCNEPVENLLFGSMQKAGDLK